MEIRVPAYPSMGHAYIYIHVYTYIFYVCMYVYIYICRDATCCPSSLIETRKLLIWGQGPVWVGGLGFWVWFTCANSSPRVDIPFRTYQLHWPWNQNVHQLAVHLVNNL